MNFSPIPGGLCAPQGYLAAGITCGIKDPDAPKKDLALIFSEAPCTSAGVYTKNRVTVAPVQLCRQVEAGRAILANSGNANAATGAAGMADARAMAAAAAEALGIDPGEVFVGSTGIIGKGLPMDRILPRVPELRAALSADGSADAAAAIMTSDTRPKELAIQGDGFRIGGIAKGAGMIRPDMATMLAFLTTDAGLPPEQLQRCLQIATDQSFNRITIDGDMSTNDTALLLANGQAGTTDVESFQVALNAITLELARMIVRDGERVTKFVEVLVKGAASETDARKVADAVANSNLVKASWNGEDPNWGRVIHAVGYSGAEIDPEAIDIYFGDLIAARHGLAVDTPLLDLIAVVQNRDFRITIDLHQGDGESIVYASDLSPEYVDFNRTEYHSLATQGGA